VVILLRELCRLHNVPLPPDLDNLILSQQIPQEPAAHQRQPPLEDIESDQDDNDDAAGESEQESEVEEDIPFEEVRTTNKVCVNF